MIITLLLFLSLAGILSTTLSSPSSRWSTTHSAILYQNDGNWTAHATTPSAILFFDTVPYSEAERVCAEINEALITRDDLSTFWQSLNYQIYLGKVSSVDKFWTINESSHSHTSLPFICTNSAPLVNQTDPGYYRFPTVNVTSNGTIFTGVRDHMAYRFLKVPYTLPPVGELRLALPVLWYSNETEPVLNCTVYGPTCPASPSSTFGSDNPYGLNPWNTSEDCLTLNIFTPYLPGTADADPSTLKPVLYWFHGGGGTGTDPTYDGASIVSRSDVILVTVSWRTGNFGTLSLNDGYVMGNYGLADVIAGLEWIQDHIKAFGGNPNNVTIFGQSAGGETTMNVVKSPKAKGLFSAAILQSAALGPTTTQEEIANFSVPAVQAICGNLTDLPRLECLRALSVEEFMNNITYSLGFNYAQIDGGAIIDGIYVLNSTIASMQNGQVNNIYYMAGSMPEEGQSLLGSAIAPNDTNFNTTLYSLAGTAASSQYPTTWPINVTESGLWTNGSNPIDAYNMTINAFTTIHLTCPGEQAVHAAHESGVFKDIYYFSNQRAYQLFYFEYYDLCTFPVGEPDQPYYRCHSGDLYEVFGTYYLFDLPIRTADDIGYTNLMQDMWGSFARTGNPNPSMAYLEARGYKGTAEVFSHFTWPSFNGSAAASMAIQYPEPWVEDLPFTERCAFVDEVYQLP